MSQMSASQHRQQTRCGGLMSVVGPAGQLMQPVLGMCLAVTASSEAVVVIDGPFTTNVADRLLVHAPLEGGVASLLVLWS